jgi:2-dehydropantoate 2-reductase
MAGPILIWGSGAIGGTVGAYLQRAGDAVHFVDRAADHVDAVNKNGLQITGPIEEFKVRAPASLPGDVKGKFEAIFLCTKAPDTASATDALAAHLADEGYVVSLQNGLNERVIAAKIGEARTIGAFINFGADYLSPGVVTYAGRGAVVVGELDGKRTPRIEALHRLLKKFDDRAVLTANIWGYLWSKLAYGALLFATALTNDSIADVLASPKHRALLIALAREVEAVGVKAGVKLESFDGFDPTAFLPGGSLAAATASLDALVAFNRRSAKTHSGIWRDLAVRRRKTEVDFQMGPIVKTGAQHKMAAPITARLIELIHDIENGKRPLDWSTLDALGEVLPRGSAA